MGFAPDGFDGSSKFARPDDGRKPRVERLPWPAPRPAGVGWWIQPWRLTSTDAAVSASVTAGAPAAADLAPVSDVERQAGIFRKA